MAFKYDEVGINKATFSKLFSDGVLLSESEYGTEENLMIINMINNYTMDVNKNIVKKLLFPKTDYSKFSYDKENNIHNFKGNDGLIIPFELLSENIENIPKSLKEELESRKRKHKCHQMAVNIGASLKGSKVLTGIIKLDKKYVLHSVVLVTGEKTKKEKIIDYTMNLIIEKDKYIEMFEFKVLNEVESEYLFTDLEVLRKFGIDAINSKVYLNFRAELMKDLEKNKFLIENEEKNTKKM